MSEISIIRSWQWGLKMGDIRVHELTNYKHWYDIDTFVETGTFRGDATNHANMYFQEVHSIEIDDGLFEAAVERFKDKPKVHIHHGHSADVLEDIIPQLKSNTLFWLDAHFPGADAHKVAYDDEKDVERRAPLEKELELIAEHRLDKFDDVLIIDDLWLYEDGPFEWGSFDAHCKKCGHGVTREGLLNGATLDWFCEAAKETHVLERDYRHQGYLIVKPKQ